MRLNIYVETLPGQDTQVSKFTDALTNSLINKKVATTVVDGHVGLHTSPFTRADALDNAARHLKSSFTNGLVIWRDTLVTHFAWEAKHDTLNRYRIESELQALSMLYKVAAIRGVPAPDVIIVPKRPTEKEYGALVAESGLRVTDQDRHRWWKNGSAFLTAASMRAGDWAAADPYVVSVNYANPDEAVADVLRLLPENIWDDYRQGGGVQVTENERFMGLTPLEIKVPKHILDQIKHEARDLSIPLDNHVAAILKKYLLEGILGP